MKMKAVCEATGLTDRTVRYYMEEKLIAPAFSENYLGRKTFDFSEGDVKTLKDVAVLRKFGYTVAEIREMLLEPQQIPRITRELQRRKESLIHEEEAFLRALSGLDAENTESVAQLAASLTEQVSSREIPVEDVTKYALQCVYEMFGNAIKTVLTLPIIWGPVVFAILMVLDNIHDYHFPVIKPRFFALTLLSFLPTALIYILPKIQITNKWRKIARRILLVICLFNWVMSPALACEFISMSRTTDIRNYRDFDADCWVNRDSMFQDMFPLWPNYFDDVKQENGEWETVYLDTCYLYQYMPGWGDTFDVYAEWPLEKEEFDEEVARVKEFFEEHAPAEEDRKDWRNYITMQKGPYTCLIIYYGEKPFERVSGNYTYYIFAYDEQNLRVRYIYCESDDDGYDQPYYLSLNWE